MMSISEIFSHRFFVDPPTRRGRAVGLRCDSRSRSEAREFGGYRAPDTWHDKIGTTSKSDILIEWTRRIVIPILNRIPSISCLGARTSRHRRRDRRATTTRRDGEHRGVAVRARCGLQQQRLRREYAGDLTGD